MNRKEIIKAGVGAELFYQTYSTYGETYRAVVESVEPKVTNRRTPTNRGVDVTLWNEDRISVSDSSAWRTDVETGLQYKRTIVDSARLKGDWKSWREEQLAQRERDAARKKANQLAEEAVLRVAIEINSAIGSELRAKLGEALRTRISGHDYKITMSAELARELLAGWQRARESGWIGTTVEGDADA